MQIKFSYEDGRWLSEEENFTEENLKNAMNILGCLLYAKRQNTDLSKEEEELEIAVNKCRFK